MLLAEIRNTITARTEQRQGLLDAATAILANTAISPEQRGTVEANFTQARQLATDIALLQESLTAGEQRQAAEERSEAERRAAVAAGRPPLPQPGTGNQNDPAAQRAADQAQREERGRQHEAAMRSYVTTRDAAELRAMGIGSGPNGGYFIPTLLQNEVDSAILSFGGVAPFLRQLLTSTGDPINWSTSNDTSNSGQDSPENVAQTEEDITLGITQLNVSTLGTGIVQVSRQLLQDSQFPIAQFVNENLSERLGRRLAGKITGQYADANFDVLQSVVAAGPVSQSGTAIGLTDIANLFGAVDPAYAKEFVMSRTTQIYMASLRNALGAPIFPLDSTGMLTSIYGLPIRVDLGMPGVAVNNRAVLCGNLQKYILRRVNGVEIMRLDERYAESGQVGFIGWMRAGGRYIDAGTHPIKALIQAAS